MKEVKLIFAAIIGTAIGFSVGYFVAKRKLEEDYQNEVHEIRERLLCNEENEKYLQVCEKNDKEERSKGLGLTEDNFTPLDIPSFVEKSSIDTNSTEYRKLVTNYNKPDLHSLIKQREEYIEPEEYTEDLEEILTEEELNELEEREELERTSRMAEVNHEAPYIIDDWQYSNECDHYDKIDIYYYKGDDTICDERDSIIEDAEDILGWDFYTVLDRQTIAYVRNEKLQSDFMIHCLHKNYASDVLGWVGTDREKEYWRKARKKEVLDS